MSYVLGQRLGNERKKTLYLTIYYNERQRRDDKSIKSKRINCTTTFTRMKFIVTDYVIYGINVAFGYAKDRIQNKTV